jgi:2-polyprenyl-3-methyl-5-hydroxy-6-metoxy-1,4-benzoquinol methylase
MIRLLWNLYARYYEHVVRLRPHQDMLDQVMDALDVAPGMRVLDAGCGSGILGERLAAACPNTEYLGVDFSPNMLRQARARCLWPSSFNFKEADVDDLLANNATCYDRIVSVNLIWTLEDPQRTLKHMTARLVPGGRMVHATPRFAFRAGLILWRHLRSQRGWALCRALLGLPVLLLVGFLNLLLLAQAAILARDKSGKLRWHKDGLIELLRNAGAEPRDVRLCYAGQDYLVVAERARAVPIDTNRGAHPRCSNGSR